ncbi:hypothetical protein [Mucilaginibacter polytrichastri]|uniref:Uncharacterized protein n=1 Tax=Mucilaginibacter polytrichastri TaxID=1302689 RepID=A0A1Q6A2H9_9SPHI|nr:hypothetical protein [Mucilaginibacter polytrichastri]OKS88220.1 hypothetical protein RG47T_3684 [Mucilaginibacter polytrichastri]SFT08134.1 hypothetical protein SAMN04487890_11013 [Mucilaginibacter polytrichastri]
MKKLIAITLLSVHLLNIGGQLAIYQYLLFKSNIFYNEQVNKNRYNIKDVTEISIPVNLPHITDWVQYESIAGQIQFNNVSYNYVKMRMTRHAMYLICVPNYATTHLSGDNIIDARQTKQVPPVSKKEHVPSGKMLLIAACNHHVHQYSVALTTIVFKRSIHGDSPDIINCMIAGPGQPPDSRAIFS